MAHFAAFGHFTISHFTAVTHFIGFHLAAILGVGKAGGEQQAGNQQCLELRNEELTHKNEVKSGGEMSWQTGFGVTNIA